MDMDPQNINNLAQAAVTVLHPYWSTITAVAATKLGEALPSAIKALWDKIWDRSAKKASARESLAELLEKHDDADLEAAFRVQLRKLLAEDPGFADDVERSVQNTGTMIQYSAKLDGNGNINVQGNNNQLSIGQTDEKKK